MSLSQAFAESLHGKLQNACAVRSLFLYTPQHRFGPENRYLERHFE